MAKKRKMTAKQLKYFGKRKANPARKRRRSVTVAAKTTTRRRRRNPPAPARRRRRRNPPTLSARGILGLAMQGVKDGAFVAGGKLGVRLVSSRFGYTDGSMMDSLIEVATAMVLGMFGGRVVGQDGARFLMAGGFDSVIETLVAQAGIPNVSGLLGNISPTNTSTVYPAADASSLRVLALQGYRPGLPKPVLSIGPEFSRISGYPAPATGARGMTS